MNNQSIAARSETFLTAKPDDFSLGSNDFEYAHAKLRLRTVILVCDVCICSGMSVNKYTRLKLQITLP